jgi:hypothetical protein
MRPSALDASCCGGWREATRTVQPFAASQGARWRPTKPAPPKMTMSRSAILLEHLVSCAFERPTMP